MAIALSGDRFASGTSIEFLTQCVNEDDQDSGSRTNDDRIYARLVKLVEDGDYDTVLPQTRSAKCDRIKNLRAVALMRCGRPGEAVNLLRSIVIASNSLEYKPNVAAHVVANFATALFMTGNVSGCVEAIRHLSGSSPSTVVVALQRNVAAWEKSLSFWKWLDWKVCGIEHVKGELQLDFQPGDLS